MRDPHGFLWAIILVLTPVGWCMAVGFHIARTARAAIHKAIRRAS